MWAVGCARLVLHLNHLLPSSGSTLPTPLDNPSDNGRPCSALVVVFGAGRSVGLGAGVFRKRGFPRRVSSDARYWATETRDLGAWRTVASIPGTSSSVSCTLRARLILLWFGRFRGVFGACVSWAIRMPTLSRWLLFGCGGALSRAKETLASGWVKRLRSPSPL